MATQEELEKLRKAYEEAKKRYEEADNAYEKALDTLNEAEAAYKPAHKAYYPIYKAYKNAKQAFEDADLEWNLAYDAFRKANDEYQDALQQENAKKEANKTEEEEILCEVCHKPIDKFNSIILLDGSITRYWHWECFGKINKQTTEFLSKTMDNFIDAVENKKANIKLKPFKLEDKKNWGR